MQSRAQGKSAHMKKSVVKALLHKGRPGRLQSGNNARQLKTPLDPKPLQRACAKNTDKRVKDRKSQEFEKSPGIIRSEM